MGGSIVYTGQWRREKMFNVGDKVKWMGMSVTILTVDEMNMSKGVRRLYGFISPTGNYIGQVPEEELTL